jgi:hypothetical protein
MGASCERPSQPSTTHALPAPTSNRSDIQMSFLLRPTAALLLATTAIAAPSDWIVDDDGGPGVDFTRVKDAVIAASHGDRIFVHPGSYPHLVSSAKGISIVGVGSGVVINGLLRWQGMTAGRELRVTGVELSKLELLQCGGPVSVTEFTLSGGSGIQVTDCADVRLRAGEVRAFTPTPSLRLSNSRVELVGCAIYGVDGYDGNLAEDAEPGQDAIVVGPGALLTMAASSAYGGDGGTAVAPTDCSGSGGDAVRVEAGGELVVTGSLSDTLQGGATGSSLSCSTGGRGITSTGGAVRISGVVPQGGSGSAGTNEDGAGAGVFTHPNPAAPYLELAGDSMVGQTLTFTLHGEPGAQAVLMAGRAPSLGSWPGSGDTLLTSPVRQFYLGNLDGSGQLTHTIVLPAYLQPGNRFVFQARFEGGLTPRLTNSAPMIVR